jgi:hypothetical protein
MSKAQEEILCSLMFWEEEGQFQKDKTNVNLPDHWVSELGSIRGNMPK